MKLLFILAWRNLWRNRKRSMITISSVLFAVLLAIVFDSMERGSYERMIDSMVKYSTGYIQIQDVMYEEEPSIDNSLLFDEQLTDLINEYSSDIAYTVPRIQNFALAATETQTRGTMVMGIDPELEIRLNDLTDNLVSGEFLNRDDGDILLAEGLAGILAVNVGDTLVLLGQGFQGSTAAGKYRIKGLVDMKIPEMNNNAIYMTIETARWFYMAENRLTSLIIMPVNPRSSEQLAAELRENIDTEWYSVLTWQQMLKDLLALMEFDTAGSKVMMMILYIVITFGLFGTILTMMIERQREFAMLISLGMKRSRLALVCFLESIFISFTGVLAGIIAAIPIVAYFHFNPIKLKGEMAESMLDYGFEPLMPFSSDPNIFLNQAMIVLTFAFLVGLYPIYRVYKINIVEVKQQ
ncbi:MAG: ABC transporter permease [Bacteroidales bacterium]|nr:ABC transporter permease [Bacteroidales bacterium]